MHSIFLWVNNKVNDAVGASVDLDYFPALSRRPHLDPFAGHNQIPDTILGNP